MKKRAAAREEGKNIIFMANIQLTPVDLRRRLGIQHRISEYARRRLSPLTPPVSSSFLTPRRVYTALARCQLYTPKACTI